METGAAAPAGKDVMGLAGYGRGGSSLTQLRKRAKLTGKQVAKQIGAPAATYYRYEKEPEKIPAHYLQRLCKLLGCTGEEILGLTEFTEFAGKAQDGEVRTPEGEQGFGPQESDDELQAYLEQLRSRSEIRLLFSLAKDATKEDVERAARIIEALAKEST